MSDEHPIVVNIADVPEEHCRDEAWPHYEQSYKVLTPALSRPGSLGVNVTRVPPGKVACPFHYHVLEDEVFYVLSGTGVLRYGDQLLPLKPGDCVSCPAGSKTGHQIANNGGDDLVYLAIGRNDPNEVCAYPDSGKVMVRALGQVGRLGSTAYMDGEPNPPVILGLA